MKSVFLKSPSYSVIYNNYQQNPCSIESQCQNVLRISMCPGLHFIILRTQLIFLSQFKPNMLEYFWNSREMWIVEVPWKSLTGKRKTQTRGTMLSGLAKQLTHHLEPGVVCTASSRARLWKKALQQPLATNPLQLYGLPLFWGHQRPLYLLYQHEAHVCNIPQSPLAHITGQWSPTAKKNSYLYQRKVSVHKDSDLYQHSPLVF